VQALGKGTLEGREASSEQWLEVDDPEKSILCSISEQQSNEDTQYLMNNGPTKNL